MGGINILAPAEFCYAKIFFMISASQKEQKDWLNFGHKMWKADLGDTYRLGMYRVD